jgi:hypothetical protein
MFLATSNKARRLLCLSYVERVKSDEFHRGQEDGETLLADLPPGFRLLEDLNRLETIDLDCVKGIGRMMDLFDQNSMGVIVRVIHDSGKDIGFNILTLFHYPHHPHIVTCKTMTEAAKLLTL